jgi:acyl carrier protein
MLEVSEWQTTLSTLLSEDLGLDSLDLVQLATELEKEFGVTIPDEQAGNIKTIGEAVSIVEALAGRGADGEVRQHRGEV